MQVTRPFPGRVWLLPGDPAALVIETAHAGDPSFLPGLFADLERVAASDALHAQHVFSRCVESREIADESIRELEVPVLVVQAVRLVRAPRAQSRLAGERDFPFLDFYQMERHPFLVAGGCPAGPHPLGEEAELGGIVRAESHLTHVDRLTAQGLGVEDERDFRGLRVDVPESQRVGATLEQRLGQFREEEMLSTVSLSSVVHRSGLAEDSLDLDGRAGSAYDFVVLRVQGVAQLERLAGALVVHPQVHVAFRAAQRADLLSATVQRALVPLLGDDLIARLRDVGADAPSPAEEFPYVDAENTRSHRANVLDLGLRPFVA